MPRPSRTHNGLLNTSSYPQLTVPAASANRIMFPRSSHVMREVWPNGSESSTRLYWLSYPNVETDPSGSATWTGRRWSLTRTVVVLPLES